MLHLSAPLFVAASAWAFYSEFTAEVLRQQSEWLRLWRVEPARCPVIYLSEYRRAIKRTLPPR